MKVVIKMAERMHPEKKLVFIFDNSSAHNSLAKNALSVNKMNVGPGGKAASDMRETEIPVDNPHGSRGKIQKMQFDKVLPEDHLYKKYEGQAKGIKVILEERGLIPATPPGTRASKHSNQLPGECQICKSLKRRKSKMEDVVPNPQSELIEDDDEDSEDEDRPSNCCMRCILSLQTDFQNEKSMLYKVSYFVLGLD